MEIDLDNMSGRVIIDQHVSFVQNGYCKNDCKKCIFFNRVNETCKQVSLVINFPLFESEDNFIPLSL